MGGIVIVESTSGGTTDGANKDLSNLTVTGDAKFKAPALISSDAGNGLTSGSDSKLFINVTGKANTDLYNLSATGEARFTAKAGVDLDNISSAGVAVIQSYATGGGANVSLSNLDATGEARFTAKANINSPTFTGVPLSTTPDTADNSTKIATTAHVIANKNLCADLGLSNITSAGNTVIQTQAKIVCQPLPVSTSGAIGELKSIYGSVSSALSVPAGGTWAIFCKYGINNSTAYLTSHAAQFNYADPIVVAGGTRIANALSGFIACAVVMRIA